MNTQVCSFAFHLSCQWLLLLLLLLLLFQTIRTETGAYLCWRGNQGWSSIQKRPVRSVCPTAGEGKLRGSMRQCRPVFHSQLASKRGPAPNLQYYTTPFSRHPTTATTAGCVRRVSLLPGGRLQRRATTWCWTLQRLPDNTIDKHAHVISQDRRRSATVTQLWNYSQPISSNTPTLLGW